MAEFQEVVARKKRMCNMYYNNGCCNGCPLNNGDCGVLSVRFADVDIIQRVETTVMSWAAEHPEPVYPTWEEWLIKLGIVSFEPDFRALLDASPTTLANTVKAYINEEGSKPIPADIAQKLGIEPEEGWHELQTECEGREG